MPNEAPPQTVVMWHRETGNRALVNVADVKDWKERGYSTSEPKLPKAPVNTEGKTAGAQ